ncbi:hypothetical protein PQX77_003734 [Marasmius sp. AFHP31]|nr:hypothetical protein PQX77_003734 [Marasmius sp. AFHP31]
MSDPIVVHLYSHFEALSTRPQSLSTHVLQEGREIVKQLSEESKWSHSRVLKTTKWAPGDNVYIYSSPSGSLLPPTRDDMADLVSYGSGTHIRQWGSTIDESELYSVDELTEFKSTTLDEIFIEEDKELSGEDSRSTQIEEPIPEEHLDHSSLYRVFPQPHMHVFSNFEAHRPSSVLTYSKTDPIPIHPYTINTMSSPPNRRRAWLVPVRGTFPWDHATHAVVLDPGFSPQIPRSSTSGLSLPIVWTHSSVLEFWNLLLSFKRKKTLGPIGISFTGAGSGGLRHLNRLIDRSDLEDDDDEGPPSSATRETLDLEPAPKRNSLDSVDYIKIYHNSQFSFHLRNVVDRFAFEIDAGDGGGVLKVRVLKGARLVLVDELSRGVLVS